MNGNVSVTIRFGGGNSITRQYAAGTALSRIIGDPTVQAALGYGANVQASIERRHVDGNYPVGRDVVIDLETRANQKANGVSITVRFGGANRIERVVPRGTTVGDILNDRTILAALGAGNNVQALIDRAVQDNDTPVEHGDVIDLETVANQKAA